MRRGVGYVLRQEGRMLTDFVGYCERRGITRITTKTALGWATEPAQASPTPWTKRRCRRSGPDERACGAVLRVRARRRSTQEERIRTTRAFPHLRLSRLPGDRWSATLGDTGMRAGGRQSQLILSSRSGRAASRA